MSELEPKTNLLEPDTRKKLEADVEGICLGKNDDRYISQKRYLSSAGIEVDEGNVMANHEGHVLMTVIMHLLDRQAAITEREYFDSKCYDCQDAHDRQTYRNIERYAKLKEKVDALEAELNRTCTLAYDGKWLTCSECGESMQWFGVRTVYKTDGTQERALGVEGVRFCPFCGARIEMDGESE